MSTTLNLIEMSERLLMTVAVVEGELLVSKGAEALGGFKANLCHVEREEPTIVLYEMAKEKLLGELCGSNRDKMLAEIKREGYVEELEKFEKVWADEGAAWEENELMMCVAEEGVYIYMFER